MALSDNTSLRTMAHCMRRGGEGGAQARAVGETRGGCDLDFVPCLALLLGVLVSRTCIVQAAGLQVACRQYWTLLSTRKARGDGRRDGSGGGGWVVEKSTWLVWFALVIPSIKQRNMG